MSGWALALLVVATVSPSVAALRLPGLGWRSLWPGLVAAAVIGTAVVLWAEPLARWADVESESFRVAAGLVLLATGLARLVVPVGRREEVVAGRVGWLVPVAYPVLIGPELVLALLAAGVDGDRGAGVTGLLVGLVLAGAAVSRRAHRSDDAMSPRAAVTDDGASRRRAPSDGADPDVRWRAAARLTAGVQVLLAAALTIDAIRSV